MKFPTLFTKSSSGALQEWTLEVEGNAYRTHHGQVDGKIQTTKWFTVEAKNVGRSNERTPEQQALSAAQSKYDKKIEMGAVTDPALAKYEAPFIEPMTAHKWKDLKEKDKKNIFPLYCQPKFDGMRAVIAKETGATSRGGKTWKTIPHILKALEPVFEKYPDLILDGELYNHEFHDDFNMISKLIKREKPSADDLIRAKEKVKFYWYDIADTSAGFAERAFQIADIMEEFPHLAEEGIFRVDTRIAQTENDLDAIFEQWLSDGYEGQMVRLDLPYEHKRSKSLLKRKTTEDREYKIHEVGAGNGNRTGLAAYMILVNDDGSTFRSNIKGSHTFLKEIWDKRESLKGTYATCTFLNLTPDGVPRCGWVTRLRAGIGKDQ